MRRTDEFVGHLAEHRASYNRFLVESELPGLLRKGITNMYCANCGTPLAPGLSYCNRCGNSLKERDNSKNTGAITAFLTAITLLGIVSSGIILAGALALKNEAQLGDDLVGLFMLMVFRIVAIAGF